MLARSIEPITTRALGKSLICCASFSATTINLVKIKVPPKPKHLLVSRVPNSGAVARKQEVLSADSFPSRALLIAANLDGVLDLHPDEVIELLHRYISLAKSSKNRWEEKVCEGTKATPKTLTTVALILGRSPDVTQQKLSNDILMTASNLEDASATVRVVAMALESGIMNHPRVRRPLQHLERLVKSGANIQAMFLKALILETEKKAAAAQDSFKRISNAEPTSENTPVIMKALLKQGHYFLEKNDEKSAKEVWKRSALEFEDPLCYHCLAKFLEQNGSDTQETYFLKAGAAGVRDAWHDLGVMYLDRSKTESGTKKEKDGLMAKEWLEVSAADGNKMSMPLLAEFQE